MKEDGGKKVTGGVFVNGFKSPASYYGEISCLLQRKDCYIGHETKIQCTEGSNAKQVI